MCFLQVKVKTETKIESSCSVKADKKQEKENVAPSPPATPAASAPERRAEKRDK